MEVIPVLDLLNGVVVHGRAGRREDYRPVESTLVDGSDPVPVAEALQQVASARALYLADLDAIEGRGDNARTVRDIAAAVGASLWVDAGATTAPPALAQLEAGATRAVIGTETLQSPAHFAELRSELGDDRLLLSLDMRGGVVRSASARLQGLPPLEALALLDAEDLPEVLVLPVDRVGTAAGPDLDTISTVRRELPDTRLVAGGGVRDAGDIRALGVAGAAAVLVATALHLGVVTADHVRALSGD